MDLDLEDYQDLTVKTFRDFFAKQATSQDVRNAEDTGHDPGLWKRFSDLGGLTLSLAEPVGGGGNLLDAALVGVESGRRVAPLPYAEAVVGLRLLSLAGVELPAGVAVDDVVIASVAEPGAVREGSSLTAVLPWARGGAVAALAVVVVGDEVVLVDLRGGEVLREHLPNLGRLSLARVTLTGAPVLWSGGAADQLARRACYELRLLHASELVGAGRQALALAMEHLVTRRQFGRPIGSFQAIQHRMVDRLTAVDAAELLLLRAASYESDLDRLGYFSAVALEQSSQAAELAAKEGLQFFGGYGFTLEYDIHLYLRFAKALAVLARDPRVSEDALPRRVNALKEL